MNEKNLISPSEVPTHPYARRSWITTQLALAGLTQKVLAERLGCSRQTLGKCLISPVSVRIDSGLAEALGLKPHELFPERYTTDGRRLHRVMEAAKAA